jgi:hypothetical protein
MGAIAGLEVGLPRSVAEVDAPWLTAVLRTSRAIDNATAVSSIDIEPFAVGAGLLSLLYRAGLAYSGGDGPASVIVKFPIDHPHQRGLADSLGFYPREIRFYTEVAPKSNLRTPVVHAAMMATDSTDFVVVMEDLSTRGAADQRVGATWEHRRHGRAARRLAPAPRPRRPGRHLPADAEPGLPARFAADLRRRLARHPAPRRRPADTGTHRLR